MIVLIGKQVQLEDDLTILVNIASYKDALLWKTVDDCLSNASYPDNIRFAIVDQTEIPYNIRSHIHCDKISYFHFHPDFSRGPCWARSIAHSFYAGEDYVLQIDAHTVFDKGWDIYLINALLSCQKLSEKCILSSYPQKFIITETGIVKNQKPNVITVFKPKVDAVITSENPSFSFKGYNIKSDKPAIGIHVAGGFIFAPGNFFQEILYDPCLYFIGEEQNIAIRAYTHGWDIYHYPGIPVYHLYHSNNSRPLHWDKDEDDYRQIKWYTLRERSRKRLADLLFNNENLGVYSLGKKRSLIDYSNFSGINYINKKINAI